jgi:hypothetical protein
MGEKMEAKVKEIIGVDVWGGAEPFPRSWGSNGICARGSPLRGTRSRTPS